MTQTGDDKELILGNKQLISLFFVVVALCGVFFAMGYMIGRNTGKASVASDSSVAPTGANAGLANPPRQQPEPPREASGAAADPAPVASAESSLATPGETKAARDAAPQTEPPPAARAETARADTGVSAPENGASYLQVTALPRADAEGVVRTLREQSFPVILASSSKDGLFRVLVGPYHQTAPLAEAKSRLKTMGFGSAFVQKK